MTTSIFSKRRLATFALVLGLAAAASAAPPSERAPMPEKLPKVVLISYNAPMGSSNAILVSDLCLRSLGRREFLVGKSVFSEDQDQFIEKTIWIACDEILQMIEFNTQDEAIKSLKNLEDSKPNKERLERPERPDRPEVHGPVPPMLIPPRMPLPAFPPPPLLLPAPPPSSRPVTSL